jgi:hypothetical protein
MKESSLSTHASTLDETQSTLYTILSPPTQHTSEDPEEETNTESTVEETTESLLSSSSVETSSEDHNQLSQSLPEIQTPKPETSTIDTHSPTPLLSQFSTPSSETSSELFVSVAITQQQHQISEDTSEVTASEQSTAETTLREDPSPASEVTSPLPNASTGKSEQ